MSGLVSELLLAAIDPQQTVADFPPTTAMQRYLTVTNGRYLECQSHDFRCRVAAALGGLLVVNTGI
jgi:hypothetical protein